ncbi:MAG: hypothetical protein B6D59_02475 [Campylobacteraceae bacterium 4484_4]|nr:MAG: hypothetical protein B6D59_02475 [Campylobacteraceae bacterium 4484_4]
MKKVLPILSILLIAAVIAILFISMAKKEKLITTVSGNIAKKPLKIVPGKYTDTECAMTIESEHYACEVVAPDGRTWFFDDPGCMIKWLETKDFKDKAVLWVHAEDTGNWIDARKAWYSRTDHTPMHYGFGAREKFKEGLIDFETMRLMMLRGENLTDPRIRKKLLGY